MQDIFKYIITYLHPVKRHYMRVRNYFQVLVNPKRFFNKLKSDLSIRVEIINLVFISFLIFTCWFLRIIFLVNKPEVYDANIDLYRIPFSILNIRFIGTFFGMLILNILVFFIIVSLISFISILLSKIWKLKLNFKHAFGIATYSIIPYLIASAIFFVITYLGIVEFQIYINIFAYIWCLFLNIYGVVNFFKVRPSKN
jgi:hypothetical protein